MRWVSLLVLISLLVYLLPLNSRPLGIPDEARYAEIPREMLESGDLIVPHLVGLRYFEKPPLGYWLIALSEKIFGNSNFAVRLPSALAAIGTAAILVLHAVGATLPLSTGCFAAMVLLSSVLFFAVGTLATLDSMLCFFNTLCIVSFYHALQGNLSRRQKMAAMALSGIGCGLGFLTKGFLAAALPVVVFTPYLIWERRWRDLYRSCWIPLVVTILVALPWSIMVHRAEADFWNFFFWNEHIRRFASGKAQHAEHFWFYLPALLWGFLPWTLLSGCAFKGLKERLGQSPVRFALCWFFGTLLLLSVSSGKLLTYLMPCWAPLSLLFAYGFERYAENTTPHLLNSLCRLSALILFIVAAVFFGYEFFHLGSKPVFALPQEFPALYLGLISILSWVFCLLLAARSHNIKFKLGFFALGPLMFFSSAGRILPEQTIERKFPLAFLEQQAQRIRSNTLLVADQRLAASASFVFERSDAYVFVDRGELEYGLGYPDASQRFISNREDFERLLGSLKPGDDLALVGDEGKIKGTLGDLVQSAKVTRQEGRHLFLMFEAAVPLVSAESEPVAN